MFATTMAGTKVWDVSYLPFGGVHVTTGAPMDLRFPGQWFQTESGLHQNWMRDYDPTTGRYLQADPLGLVDGASVYGYAKQNPGRWVDPRGACIDSCAIEIGIASYLAKRLIQRYLTKRLTEEAAKAAVAAATDDDCEAEDCGPLTRAQAMRQAQGLAQIPRSNRICRPWSDMNETSKGPNGAQILIDGGTHFGYRCEWAPEWRIEDHPDGHPDTPGPDHHKCPHIHVYDQLGRPVAIIPYKRGT